MTDDMYLSLAIELYEKGTWSKDVFVKRVILYAKEKDMDMTSIEEMIDRLTNPKEITIDEKRKFLSFITISDDELKYGDVVDTMPDEMVEKFYELEEQSLDKDKFKLFHDRANSKTEEIIVDNVEVVENVEISDEKETEIKKVWNTEKESFVFPSEIVEENEEIEVVGNEVFVFPGEIEKSIEETFSWDKTVNDIIIGNYTASDLLGNSDTEKEEIFRFLVEHVKVEELRDVANSLITKMEPSYCLNFTLEWEKLHKEELNDAIEAKVETIEEEKTDEIEVKEEESKVDVITSNWIEAVNEAYEEESGKRPEQHVEKLKEVESSKLVIPNLSLESYGEDDLPTTEEEYKKQAEKISKPEKDSVVRKVNISPERLAKLKKSKNKVINCFLKTGLVILAFNFLNPFVATGAIVGYSYFAQEIKAGTFNPTNPIGKAVKFTVEKVMNIGLEDKKENERGKAK